MNTSSILETIHMLEHENLDIRTSTLGISLLDCVSEDVDVVAEKVYKKVTTLGADLVETADAVGAKYGVSIVNKRISVTPVSLLLPHGTPEDFVKIAEALDAAAIKIGVDFIGGFSALVHHGMTESERHLIEAIPKALSTTEKVCASVNVGTSKSGLNMDAVRLMGDAIVKASELSKDADSIACAKLVVFANAVEDNPFMAGAFHGVGLADHVLHIGISGPGVVKTALEKYRGRPFEEVSQCISEMTFKITRMGELVGREIAERLDAPFGSIDLSLAPTPAVGDSVARILEEIGIGTVGGHGTTAALAMLNDAVKKGGINASSHVGGLSGAFIPVSEDEGMIAAATTGSIAIDKLEAMTCVCSVGLDMIAIPGDTKPSTITGMIADEAMIGIVNSKTTAVRVIPVHGKGVGDKAVFGGLLGETPIMPMHDNDCSLFAERGGFIPAPIHSFKN
ncbi:MAG: PFL family protein [Peptoniphilus sp.]|nr:PFL family protein [Peptoniphilus sp.]MDY6043980.1 PFL family protein [Peptoniphilus sp.]